MTYRKDINNGIHAAVIDGVKDVNVQFCIDNFLPENPEFITLLQKRLGELTPNQAVLYELDTDQIQCYLDADPESPLGMS